MHRWSGVLGLQQVVYVDRMPGREGICSTLFVNRSGLEGGKVLQQGEYIHELYKVCPSTLHGTFVGVTVMHLETQMFARASSALVVVLERLQGSNIQRCHLGACKHDDEKGG